MKKFPRRNVIERVAQLCAVAGGDLDAVQGGSTMHAAYAAPTFRDELVVDDDYWSRLRRRPKRRWDGVTAPTEPAEITE